MRRFGIHTASIILLSIIIFPNNVCAYINPGVGSSVFQIIIALLVTGLFVIKQFFNKIKIFFTNLFSKRRK